MEEHREDSDEPDKYEELSVKSDEKYENGGGGRRKRIKPQDSILTSWTVFSSE